MRYLLDTSAVLAHCGRFLQPYSNSKTWNRTANLFSHLRESKSEGV